MALKIQYYRPLRLEDMDGIIKSARVGDYDDVVKRVSKGEDVNTVGPQYNLTPLHLASLHGHLDIVEFLLDNGANPDVLDDWRVTPLHNAAGAGHVDVVKELCEAGADLNVRSANKGKTAIDIARDKGKYDVIPVLQHYISKNAKFSKNGGNRDQAKNAKGVGGGKEEEGVIIRRKEKNGETSKFYLPGQVEGQEEKRNANVNFLGNGSGGSREQSTGIFSVEKRQLQKQLKEIERQEKMHRLNSEHNRTVEQLELARGKYDRDLEDMLKQMEDMQVKINTLAGQRDNELTQMEKRLHEIQDSIYELERSGLSSSDGNENKGNQ